MFYLGQADKEYHNYNFDFYFQFCDEYNKTSTLSVFENLSTEIKFLKYIKYANRKTA